MLKCEYDPKFSNIIHCDEREKSILRDSALLVITLHAKKLGRKKEQGEKYVGRQNGHLYFLPIRY